MAADAHVPADVRDQAALLARMVASDEGTDDGARADAKLGVVDALAILGPFRDTGGGLDAHDGPEAGDFGDVGASYSWGTVEVRWRAVPRPFATAEGAPLGAQDDRDDRARRAVLACRASVEVRPFLRVRPD